MSFRNRCVVAGSNGVVNLSVPIDEGRNRRCLMKDVKISYRQNWALQHWRTIESCYNRSPYFEFYRDPVKELILKNDIFLIDKNMAILEWLKKCLKIPGAISFSEEYKKEYPEGTMDLRNYFLPKKPVHNESVISYHQVFEDRIGFVPGLSILDLLFCCGPDTKRILTGNN